MAQGLNDVSGKAAGRHQMLRRGMAEVHDVFAEHDAPRVTIGEPRALSGNLRRKAIHYTKLTDAPALVDRDEVGC